VMMTPLTRKADILIRQQQRQQLQRARKKAKNVSSAWMQKPFFGTQFESQQDNDTDSKSSSPSTYGSLGSPKDVSHTSKESKNNMNADHFSLDRHLSLFDLTSIGTGATIGSGIFVLCGIIAQKYAGAATFLSWAIAGVAALLSGCCYAELAANIPASGSSYLYAYIGMGELPALITAGCLTLEYLAASAGVARCWADKVSEWVLEDLRMDLEANVSGSIKSILGLGIKNESTWSPMASIISIVIVMILLKGVKESKVVTNIFTMTKLSVVVFMAVGGLMLMDTSNLTPIVPPEFGWAGVFRGATSSFFGFLGYDGICVLAGEAKNPKKNMPHAILLTLTICTLLYVVAAFALTGMQPYQKMIGEQGFPGAFRYNGVSWAAQISAAGEIVTLPIVVLVVLMGQPRLQYALAQDGLIPPWFAEIDSTGNLWNGTFFAGSIMILLASFIPFTHINDMISAAVLLSFNITDSTLIIMRREALFSDGNFLVEKLTCAFNLSAFLLAVMLTHTSLNSTLQIITASALFASMVVSCVFIYLWCPEVKAFGGERRRGQDERSRVPVAVTSSSDTVIVQDDGCFKTPLVPFLPCCGIFMNWFLVSQLNIISIFLLIGFLALWVIFYFTYSIKHSILGKSSNLRVSDTKTVISMLDLELRDDPTSLARVSPTQLL